MREIKFRAWAEASKIFIHCQLYRGDVGWADWPSHIRAADVTSEWQQCIGDKDMDGKEIYEDDIIAYRDGEYSYDAVVKWDNEGLRYYMQGIEPQDNFNFEDIEASSHRVIGNIYENPELLK